MYVVTNREGLGAVTTTLRRGTPGISVPSVSEAILNARREKIVGAPGVAEAVIGASRTTTTPAVVAVPRVTAARGEGRSESHVDRNLLELQAFVQGQLPLSVSEARELVQRAEDNVTRAVVSAAPDRDEYLRLFRALIPNAESRIQSMVAGPISVAPESVLPPEPVVHVVQAEPAGMSARNLLLLGVGIGAVLLGARYVVGSGRREMISNGY